MNKKEYLKIGKKSLSLTGTFKLTINRDIKKFCLTNLNAFVPYGKSIEDVMQFKTESGLINSLIISKPTTIYKPDESELDMYNVKVLIQHPEVRIGGITDEEHQEMVRAKLKVSNPKFTLTNVDKIITDSYDKEVELLQARAMLYKKGKDAISKERLVWLCATFGISYRSNTTDVTRYKIELTKKLDNFIQSSDENRNRFVESVNEVNRTERIFYINELINLEHIVDIGGIYKIGNKPIGATIDHLIEYYESNKELYDQHKEIVNEHLKGSIII